MTQKTDVVEWAERLVSKGVETYIQEFGSNEGTPVNIGGGKLFRTPYEGAYASLEFNITSSDPVVAMQAQELLQWCKDQNVELFTANRCELEPNGSPSKTNTPRGERHNRVDYGLIFSISGGPERTKEALESLIERIPAIQEEGIAMLGEELVGLVPGVKELISSQKTAKSLGSPKALKLDSTIFCHLRSGGAVSGALWKNKVREDSTEVPTGRVEATSEDVPF